MDVVSLYTNIPHNKGIVAIKHFLDKRVDKSPPSDFVIDMITLLLEKKKFFLQNQSAATGSKFSPDYACLFMGFLEERYIWSNNPFLKNIVMWKRYVDDMFCTFRGSKYLFNDFVSLLNNMIESIKFNVEINTHSVAFLDTRVLLESGKLSSTLYCKPTDKNSILHASSAHPSYLKKGLPYTQFLRLKRICSVESDYEQKAV